MCVGVLCAGARAAGVDRDAAELMRASLAGEPLPEAGSADLQAWRDYAQALEIAAPEAREKALRDAYGNTDSEYLRGVILVAIAEDPDFKSRQAQFIRRYGYYANWFNRVAVTFGETLQGRVAAVGQLGVDAVNDLVQPAEADPLERRAYEMAVESDAARGPDALGRIGKLRARVDRARAAEDLDRAQWALDQGDPEAAEFYAGQALLDRPGWGSAEKLQGAAAGENAAKRRRALASTQVGYPDRVPQVRPADAELARAILAGPAAAATQRTDEERLGAELNAALPAEAARGRADLLRRWDATLDRHPAAPEDVAEWARAWIEDPLHNPDRRLDQARARRRGQLARYIFIGPDTPRRRTYKAASWATQTYDALQNVGFFYVFEVLGRSVQAAVAPPVPADAVRDAQAAWLADAPDLTAPEARDVAEALASAYESEHRYDDARARLKAAGLLDGAKKQDLNTDEAKYLARLAEENPSSSATLAARARALDPSVSIKIKNKKNKGGPESRHLDWSTLAAWTAGRLPGGLPGRAAWFDGRPENGEVTADGLWFEREDKNDRDRLTLRYVIQYPAEERVYQVPLRTAQLPEPVRRWLNFSGTLGEESRQKIKRLKRLPVPLEVEGGAGMSGVEVYPKLMPIETKHGELELYQ